MNALQNSAFGQRIAAWRRRENSRHINDMRQLAEARFAVDGSRSEVRSTMVAPR